MDYPCKEVRFDLYCKTCKHENVLETESPCDECLLEPYNYETQKPIRWEDKK